MVGIKQHDGGMTIIKNTKINKKNRFKNSQINIDKKRTSKKRTVSISIMNKSVSIKPNWKGSGLDILFGLLYLKEKYNNVCVPLLSFFKKDLMWDTTIQYECKLKSKKKIARHEDYNIYLPSNSLEKDIVGKDFVDKLNECFKTKRFAIIPIFLLWNECDYSDAHFNFLIIDNKTKTMERFDPYGVFKEDSYKTLDWFDEDMEKFMKKNNFNMIYHKPISYCPQYGLQQKEENNIEKGKGTERDSDPGGYCGVWCIYYSELRVRYPDMDKNKLIAKTMKKLKSQPKNFRNFIRDYSVFILKNKKKINQQIRNSCLNYITDLNKFKECEKAFINKFIFNLFK